jgi:hypothetical protein
MSAATLDALGRPHVLLRLRDARTARSPARPRSRRRHRGDSLRLPPIPPENEPSRLPPQGQPLGLGSALGPSASVAFAACRRSYEPVGPIAGTPVRRVCRCRAVRTSGILPSTVSWHIARPASRYVPRGHARPGGVALLHDHPLLMPHHRNSRRPGGCFTRNGRHAAVLVAEAKVAVLPGGTGGQPFGSLAFPAGLKGGDGALGSSSERLDWGVLTSPVRLAGRQTWMTALPRPVSSPGRPRSDGRRRRTRRARGHAVARRSRPARRSGRGRAGRVPGA